VNYVSAASPAFTGTPTAPTASAGTNTTQLATTAFVATAAANVTSGFRNVVINGSMDVWQRGNSFTTDNAANYIYTADRWVARALYPNSSAVQVITRESTHVPTGFVYSLKSVVGTAAVVETARMQIGYTMENIDALKYAGKTLTVSCQIKAIGNINRVYIGANYNTSGGKSLEGTNISYTNFTINTSSFTTCTFTFTVPSAATLTSSGTLGIYFIYNRSSGAEQVGDGIYLGAVQMEAGSVVTPFEQRPYGIELQMCQRYYWRQNSEVTGVSQRIGGTGSIYGGNTFVGVFNMPVTMRTRPTGSLEYSGLMCTDDISFDSTGGTWSISTNYGSPRSVLIYGGPLTGTVSMQYVKLGIQSGANNYMAISAEL
jgi:hypothetical protein